MSFDYDALGETLRERTDPLESTATGWSPAPDDGWPDPPCPESNGEERLGAIPIPRPLVLVGGFGANGLALPDRRADQIYFGRQIWPPFHFHPNSGEWSFHGLSEVNLPGLLPTSLVIGQYEPLLLFLEQELGYQPNVNLFVFPYRWTDSNRITARRLAGFLEAVLPGRKVDILSHSMGGLIARAAGLLYGAPLERVIYMACPFYGAGKCYFNLHPSHVVQLVDNLLLNRVLARLAPDGALPWDSTTDLTQCFQAMESLFELLPDNKAFALGLSPVSLRSHLGAPPRPVPSWLEAYIEQSTTAFPPQLQPSVRAAMAFKDRLGDAMPGGPSLTLYSSSHPTASRVDLAFEVSSLAFFGNPYDPGGAGDGTVPAASARGPLAALQIHGRHLSLPNHRLTFYWLARFLATT